MPRADARHSPMSEPETQLDAYRRSIDNIDAAIVHMLAERFRITQAVGQFQGRSRNAPGRSNA